VEGGECAPWRLKACQYRIEMRGTTTGKGRGRQARVGEECALVNRKTCPADAARALVAASGTMRGMTFAGTTAASG
jgi:hypothetical protein